MTPPDNTAGTPGHAEAPGTARPSADRDTADSGGDGAEGGREGGGIHSLLVGSVQDYAIVALAPDGTVLSWNAGAEALEGHRPGEIVGRPFSVFYPPEDVEAGKPARELEEALRAGRVESQGWRLRKDGSRFWANVVITPMRSPDGSEVGFAMVARDLTERRQAEEVLRESEERFRLLVQGVRDYAIFMLDPDGRIASWNEGARRIKGYTAEEIVGRHFSTFYPAADLADRKPERELRIASSEGKYEEEGWRVRKDGSLFWASVLITAIRGSDGTLKGFAKVTRDLTERRAARERELADALKIAEAEASSRTKSEFLAAMSHELRTPINATLGYVDLLGIGFGGPVTEQQDEYLSRIRGSQQHLLGIINDLLNYSRLEAGNVEYALSVVPLQTVVDEVIPMVEPQAVSKGLTVEHERCAEQIVARCDRVKAQQITLNLLSNAVKFTPSGGHVWVSCGSEDGRVVITVADNGPGIPHDQLETIFQPFVQLGRSLTSGHEGTGLGLSISRDLARAMGGDLTVESTPGEGATFTFSLPRG